MNTFLHVKMNNVKPYTIKKQFISTHCPKNKPNYKLIDFCNIGGFVGGFCGFSFGFISTFIEEKKNIDVEKYSYNEIFLNSLVVGVLNGFGGFVTGFLFPVLFPIIIPSYICYKS